MTAHPIEALFAGVTADPATQGPLAASGVFMMDGEWRPLRQLTLQVHAPKRRGPVIVGIPLRNGRGRLARLRSWTTLPTRVRTCERALVESGCRVTRYAVEPSLSAPALIYELGSIAEEYATTHLLGHSGRWSLVRRVLRWWLSCDPSVGGIILIGTRP
ncbi:MAG: hypothetical protein DMF84_10335 [Acidobacteria bacterium]|nr:MAG: hypothetical protein DMF84_10335 [Acidobacteriota bacterium]